MKRKIQLTESQLHRIVKECIKNINESYIDSEPRSVFKIFSEYDKPDVKTVRPGYCYAHGELEKDMGSDIFNIEYIFKNNMYSSSRMVKPGRYKCEYNDEPCLLYVWKTADGMTEGLCSYTYDKNALKYILSEIDSYK